MDDLDRDLSRRKLLVYLSSHTPDIVYLVLSQRLVPLSQIERSVELIEGDHAKFLLDKVVHHDAQFLIGELGLKVGDFLPERPRKVLREHAQILLVPPIPFNDLLGTLLVIVELAADHVDHELSFNELILTQLSATWLLMLPNLHGLRRQADIIQELECTDRPLHILRQPVPLCQEVPLVDRQSHIALLQRLEDLLQLDPIVKVARA